MQSPLGGKYVLWIAWALAFWGLNEVTAWWLPIEDSNTLVIRNALLTLTVVPWIFLLRRFQSQVGTPLFLLLGLWVFGAFFDAANRMLENPEHPGAIVSLLAFPLTTLTVATYSGILPALILVSVATIFAARGRN